MAFNKPRAMNTPGLPRPAIRNLRDLICVFEVTGYDPNATFQEEVKPEVRFNVLAMGPVPQMEFGDKPNEYIPNQFSCTLPAVFLGISANNVNIVSALKDFAGAANPLVLGKVALGKARGSNRPPFNIVDLDTSEAQWETYADQVWTAYRACTWTSPIPTHKTTGQDIETWFASTSAAATPPPAPAQQWSQPAAAAIQPPIQPAPTIPQRLPQQPPLDQAYANSLPPAPPAVPAMPQSPTPAGAPASVDPQRWAAMSPAEQQMILQALGGGY